MSHYNTKYTKVQIDEVLEIIQECIRNRNYSISMNENRQENMNFVNNYRLTSEKQRDLLLRIQTEDFCHSVQNTKKGFEHEVLYVFCPQEELIDFNGVEELVDIYIKFNIIQIDTKDRVVTISFHKRNKEISYLFR